MYRAIWVAGMPRAGSMWTYNVVREIVRSAGKSVLPEEAPVSDQESGDYANREIVRNQDPNTVFVFKIHSFIEALPDQQLAISNIRDVRDTIMSFMRFMHVDFATALSAAKDYIRLADHYESFPEDRCVLVRYVEIVNDPEKVIARLARRIGVDIKAATGADIAARFSKDRVKALTDDKDRQLRRSLETGEQVQGTRRLERGNGIVASFDLETGFQSNHVSSYQEGDWRHMLSEDQIEALNQDFGSWLIRHGYAT